MRFLQRWLVVVAVAVCSVVARADAYDGKPKLVVILVFDQFRGDFLDRYRADFKAKNGWNLFLKQGAHFTDCYYDYANLITAAGHSTIGTGAYTDGHGIPLNEWYERGADGKLRQVSSVQDDRYTLVGAPAGTKDLTGASAHRELASTLGDELVLATGGKARVYGVSMKDRAAILTSGHASKGAFWVDHDSGQWETSTYWMKQLPTWATEFNASGAADRARTEGGVATGLSFYERVGRTAASVRYQLDFAKALITNEKLGQNPAGVPDLIAISVSSTDINGHAFGPDDPSQKALVVGSDAALDEFFTYLDKTVGLKNVMVAMSGDHGVATSQVSADAMGMPALDFPATSFTEPLEKALQKRWPLKGKGAYVITMDNPYLLLNQAAFEAAGVREDEAENATRELLTQIFAGFASTSTTHDVRQKDVPVLTHAYTSTEMREGRLPDTQYGRLVAHSYSPYVGWALHLNFGPYQFPWHGSGTTHFSANSYDRHVPLELFGAAFVPGTYHGVVAPVDIAATFASLLRINRPSAAVGRVLTEAIKPEAAGSTWVRESATPHTAVK
ncbi:alkaline phosphatase family protein [Terriglobus saanensis]|uniref:Type I phosphodiesterase/nucleotide pyrophosphatase n=1 Tax=Terriglobus saanensis (strain ATCC BAA-1853 / DSM 23119 / SP1PR4) TaxID=401053 RepID=E8V881_TERSS|nr:alkaline phosphatase family protein [Terriglobus saanensis]ADV81784.1 type I phosphodiesterase/nucleotide pyrophosphatase [Terriglobus saanensis SP1PR4]